MSNISKVHFFKMFKIKNKLLCSFLQLKKICFIVVNFLTAYEF